MKRDRLSNRYILVATPEEPLGSVLRGELAKAGFRVIAARDGHEAILYAQEQEKRAGIMIFDTNLSGLNGYVTCRLIRESGNSEAVIILMTGFNVPSIGMKEVIGYNEQISKPINMPTLMKVVARWTPKKSLPEGTGLETKEN